MRSKSFLWALLAHGKRRRVLVILGLATFALLITFQFSIQHYGARWKSEQNYLDKLPYYTWDSEALIHPPANGMEENAAADPNICDRFPAHLFERVQIVLKIGTAEDRGRLNASLSTVLSCIPNLLVFSDMAEKVGTHDAIDILANLPLSYRNNADFAAYQSQREAKEQGKEAFQNGEGWKLDRFKFLPMVEMAYALRPLASWYVFLEADTYISWDNLLRFLNNFDPAKPLYMGVPIPGSPGKWFAHGGSGWVLSTGAISKFLSRKKSPDGTYMESPVSVRFEEAVAADCCGDAALGYALFAQGIKLSGYYPMFNGDNTEEIKINKDNWCNPIISLHHIEPMEMNALWQWEMGRVDKQVRLRSLTYQN